MYEFEATTMNMRMASVKGKKSCSMCYGLHCVDRNSLCKEDPPNPKVKTGQRDYIPKDGSFHRDPIVKGLYCRRRAIIAGIMS